MEGDDMLQRRTRKHQNFPMSPDLYENSDSEDDWFQSKEAKEIAARANKTGQLDESDDDEYENISEDDNVNMSEDDEEEMVDIPRPSEIHKKRKQKKHARGSLRSDNRVWMYCPGCKADRDDPESKYYNKEVKLMVVDATTLKKHFNSRHKDNFSRSRTQKWNTALDWMKEKQQEARIERLERKRYGNPPTGRRDNRNSRDRRKVCYLCRKVYSHTTLYRAHFSKKAKRPCQVAEEMKILTDNRKDMTLMVTQCRKFVQEQEETPSRIRLLDMKPDMTDKVTLELKSVKLTAVYMNEAIANLVADYSAGPYGKHRVCEDIIKKVQNKEKVTPEERRLLAAPTYTRNRLLNIFSYFFPTGSFHLAELMEIAYYLGDSENFAKYRVRSRKDNKSEPKAPGTITNECRAIMILCDVIATQFYYSATLQTITRHVCKCMGALSNNMSRDQKKINNKKVIVGSTDDLIPRNAVLKYFTNETVMLINMELLRKNFTRELELGKTYSNREIYKFSRHLAMWMLIRYAKRPVVVRSLTMENVKTAMDRRAEELKGSETEEPKDPSSPVYLAVYGEHPTTSFKTTNVSTYAITPARWKQIENFYELRLKVQKAQPLNGFFVSAEGFAITNITGQIVYPAWRDDAGIEDNFGGPVMRHTMCTWSSHMMTPEGQVLVAKAMEHSKKTAEKTYTHSHRAEAEEYMHITKHMFNNMDEFIDPDDMVEAQAEWDAYNLEQQEENTGAIVLSDMRKLLQTRELIDEVRDSEEEEDGNEENDSDLTIQRSEGSQRRSEKQRDNGGNGKAKGKATDQGFHVWTKEQTDNFEIVYKEAFEKCVQTGKVTTKGEIQDIAEKEIKYRLDERQDTLEEMRKIRSPFHFLMFGLYDAPKKDYRKLQCRIETKCKRSKEFQEAKEALKRALEVQRKAKADKSRNHHVDDIDNEQEEEEEEEVESEED